MPQTPEILADRESWVALDKPAGWHSVAQRAKGKANGPSVEAWLRERFEWAGALPEAGLVHRLDQLTSGLLIAAKSLSEQARLRRAFQSGQGVEKWYLALVKPGIAPRGEFTLFFTSRYRRSKKVTVSEEGEAKHAGRCRWRVTGRSDNGDRLEVELIGPGRRHQIRAGLAYLGHPIRGDVLYGEESRSSSGAGAGAIALHAWRIAIDDTRVEAHAPD